MISPKQKLTTWLPLVALLLVPLAAQAQIEVPATAYAEGGDVDGTTHAEVRLIADRAEITPGEAFRVGVHFTLSPDWHVYWRSSGQSGLPTQVTFNTPGLEIGEVQYPAPEVLITSDGSIITYGYSHEVTLFSEAVLNIPSDDIAPSTADIEVSVVYLICDPGTCIWESAELSRTLSVSDVAQAASDTEVAAFDWALAQLPREPEITGYTVESTVSQDAVRPGDSFELAVELIACAGPPASGEQCPELTWAADAPRNFALDGLASVELQVVDAYPHPDVYRGFVVRLEGEASSTAVAEEQHLTGVLLFERDGAPQAIEIDVPVPRAASDTEVVLVDSAVLHPPDAMAVQDGAGSDGAGADSQTGSDDADDSAGTALAGAVPSTDGEAGGGPGLLYVLFLALLGGLILNVMPCVFPVLSLKVFALVETAHHKRAVVMRHSGMYTLGIVAAMSVLAGVVVGLKATGLAVGWGFQFQSPIFIAVMAGALVLFALNLFGVFVVQINTVGLGQMADGASGVRRSFFDGVLAVGLATPCSAPFLGTATGVALLSPAPVVFLIFITIGLGLALPFVILTMIPGWAKLLPRPGAWMIGFRQFLGFAMLGAVIFLAWVIGGLTGTSGMTQLLIFLTVVGIGGWLIGTGQRREGRPKAIIYSLAALVVVATAYLTFDFEFISFDDEPTPAAGGDELAIEWQRWSDEAVAEALAAGNVVMVDFTAVWCITCNLNKANVIESEPVMQAIDDLDITMFRADFSRHDSLIQAKLLEFRRGGVPMNLVYSPDDPNNPLLLPEVLSESGVLDALYRAAGQEPDQLSAL